MSPRFITHFINNGSVVWVWISLTHKLNKSHKPTNIYQYIIYLFLIKQYVYCLMTKTTCIICKKSVVWLNNLDGQLLLWLVRTCCTMPHTSFGTFKIKSMPNIRRSRIYTETIYILRWNTAPTERHNPHIDINNYLFYLFC